jgi:PTS system cellobiose-specific IIB component
MKKILLLCAAGMSTSILVNKMKEAANKNGIEVQIEAVSLENFENKINEYDVFLLGPQVRFKKNELQEKANALGKPLDVINTMDYGLMKGDKVLEFALNLIK